MANVLKGNVGVWRRYAFYWRPFYM